MRRLRWLAPVLIAAAMLVAACGGSDSGGGFFNFYDQASSKPIKIGASLPLTGEFSEPGKAAKQGYEVWEAMTNDRAACSAARSSSSIKDDATTRTRSSPTTTR